LFIYKDGSVTIDVLLKDLAAPEKIKKAA